MTDIRHEQAVVQKLVADRLLQPLEEAVAAHKHSSLPGSYTDITAAIIRSTINISYNTAARVAVDAGLASGLQDFNRYMQDYNGGIEGDYKNGIEGVIIALQNNPSGSLGLIFPRENP